MPLNLDLCIPEDDSLRLLIEITEEMDYRELYAAYERRESAEDVTANQLFQLDKTLLLQYGVYHASVFICEYHDTLWAKSLRIA